MARNRQWRYPRSGRSHRVQKKIPKRLSNSENDIYINNWSSLEYQVCRCLKLFQEGSSELVIHGLGAAVPTAINVALVLQKKLSDTVNLDVNTSTETIVDDYMPLNDFDEPYSLEKLKSAIHVKVSRKINF